MQLKGVEVTVNVGDNVLPEYDVRHDAHNENKIACLIASELGKVRTCRDFWNANALIALYSVSFFMRITTPTTRHFLPGSMSMASFATD